jgi:hypothetical protein
MRIPLTQITSNADLDRMPTWTALTLDSSILPDVSDSAQFPRNGFGSPSSTS